MKKEDVPQEIRDYVRDLNAIKINCPEDIDRLEKELKTTNVFPVEPKEREFVKGFMERICNINDSTNVYKIKNIINEMRVLNILDYNEYMYLQNVCDSTIKYLVSLNKK